MKLRLLRCGSFAHCIIGELELPELTLYTLERPWRDNAENVSCIPVGLYRCDWHGDDVHGLVLRVLDVPGRSGIYFHAANYARELRGCIAPGMGLSSDGEGVFVVRSREAMRHIRELQFEAEEMQLEVDSISDEAFG